MSGSDGEAGLEALSVAELSRNFKQDSAGNLYWRGKRIRAGGWSDTRWGLVISGFAALVLLFANLDRVQANLGLASSSLPAANSPGSSSAPAATDP